MYRKTPTYTSEEVIKRNFTLKLPNNSTAQINLFSGSGDCISGSIRIGKMIIYIEPPFKNGKFKNSKGMVAAFLTYDDGHIEKLSAEDVGVAELNNMVLEKLNADLELHKELEARKKLVAKRLIINELVDTIDDIDKLNKKRIDLEAKLEKME